MSNNRLEWVVQSAAFQRLLHAARLVAVTGVPVWVHGEPGSGVTSLVRYLHQVGRRADQPLRILSAGDLDAASLQQALSDDRGSLCIDRIEELEMAVQGELFRWLERQAMAGPRLLVTSHADLQDLTSSGAFRQDLLYRLQVVPLEVPPLRERLDALSLLVKTFLHNAARRHQRRTPRPSVSCMNRLRRHAWPGNLRELANLCEQWVILYPGETLKPELAPAGPVQGRAVSGASDIRLPLGGLDLAELERDLIRQALEQSDGNRSQAARLLGLTRDTLLYRLQKYALS